MIQHKPSRFALYDDVQFNHETVSIVSVFTIVPHGSWVYVIRRKAGAGYTCEIQPEEVLASGGASLS
jgi:hypothetical protein